MAAIKYILCAIALLALCQPNNAYYFFSSSLNEAFKGVLPGDVSALYAQFDAAELAQVKLAGAQLDNGGDADALRILQQINEPLHSRVLQARDGIQHKIDSLQVEAHDFVESLIEQARALRPSGGAVEQADTKKTRLAAAHIIKQLNALSAEARANLGRVFPEIVTGIESTQFQALANGQSEL